MPFADSNMTAWIGVGVLCALAVGLAWLIRFGRGPGAAVMGGILAGLLVGPNILGGAFPHQHESWFVGGIAQRRNLEVQASAYEGAPIGQAPVQPDDGRIRALQDDLDAARHEHAVPLQWTAGALAAILLLIGAQRVRPFAGRQWLSAASIGLWAALAPAGLAWLGLRFLWDQPVWLCSAIAAALAIGPWALNDGDRRSADEAEIGGARLIVAAGRIATLIALGLVAHAVVAGGLSDRVTLLWPLAGLILGWALPDALPARLRDELHFAVMAILAASISVRINLYTDLNVWMILLFALLSGDGRWTGAWLGALTLGGRAGLRTLRMVLGSMACGPTQLALSAVLLHTGFIRIEPAAALLAGALLIELFAPVRRRVAEHIRETEEELEKLREEDE